MAQRNSKSNSSMPKTPALKGKRWTKQLRDRIVGRWLLIGWSDSPMESGVAFEDGTSDPLVWFPRMGRVMHIDSPEQVIDISYKIQNDNPYTVRRNGEWSVV